MCKWWRRRDSENRIQTFENNQILRRSNPQFLNNETIKKESKCKTKVWKSNQNLSGSKYQTMKTSLMVIWQNFNNTWIHSKMTWKSKSNSLLIAFIIFLRYFSSTKRRPLYPLNGVFLSVSLIPLETAVFDSWCYFLWSIYRKKTNLEPDVTDENWRS